MNGANGNISEPIYETYRSRNRTGTGTRTGKQNRNNGLGQESRLETPSKRVAKSVQNWLKVVLESNNIASIVGRHAMVN